MKSILEVPCTDAEILTWQPPFSFDLLFAAAQVAVLIVDAATLRISEANPAAIGLLGCSGTDVRGEKLTSMFEPSSHAPIQAALGIAQENSCNVPVRSRSGGECLQAALSLFHAHGKSYFLVRLNGARTAGLSPTPAAAADSPVLQALDGAPFGFVITDARLRIDYANQAFLGMLNLPTQQALLGQPLLQWLRLTEQDLSQLKLQLSQRRALTHLTAVLVRLGQDQAPCEVQAIGVPAGTQTCWGFCVSLLRRLN